MYFILVTILSYFWFLDEKSLFTLEITNKYFNDSVKDMTWIWDKFLLNRTGGYSVLRPYNHIHTSK